MPAALFTAAATAIAALVPGAISLAPALSVAAPAGTPVAITTPQCATPAMFTFTPKTGTYLGASVSREIVAGTANCASAKGVPNFVKKVNANANLELAQWKKQWTVWADAGGPFLGSYSRTHTVLVDVPGLVVLEARSNLDLGGAHGTDVVRYDILNTTSGAGVTEERMLAEMQRLGGPNWNFERELNRWAPDLDFPGGDITRDEVEIYPARAGMHITIAHCAVYACAAGVVQYTIPWRTLLAPEDDLSFVPNAWGH